MTLPKFILQLVHIFAEIGIEKGLPESLPAIYFKKEEPKNYEYKYYRIDRGGGGLPETLTHTATAYFL